MIASYLDVSSILIRDRVLTESQLTGARQLQRQTNGRLPDVLVEFGYASVEQVRSALAELGDPSDDSVYSPAMVPKIKIERLMHRNSIAVQGETAAAYCLVKLTAVTDCLNVEMHIRPIRDVKIKRLRQVSPEIRHVELKEPEPRHLVSELGTIARGKTSKYVMDFILPKRPDGKWTVAMIEISFDPGTGIRESVTVPIEVVYTSAGHGYINAEVARHIDEIQIAELNCSLQSAIEHSKTDDVQRIAEQLMRKGEVMGKAGAKRTMLGKQVLQEIGAGGRVSQKTITGGVPLPLVERQATIRYYHRMSPERMFPLLVVIADKEILEVVKQHVVQQHSEKFHVELDSMVEVEPILPGCDCFPPRESVRITDAESSAQFWVVPRVLGEVSHARVIVRQNGVVLAEVPLEIRVAKQTVTLFVGAMNFCVPFVSMLLKQSQMSLAAPEAGGGLLAWLVSAVLFFLSPEVMAGVLLLATVGLYLWLRPRQRDVFWDIQTAAPAGERGQS